MTSDRASLTKAFSLVLALTLVLAGGLTAVLASGKAERLISGLGLGLMVVGIESFFRSATLFRFEREELSKEIVKELRQVLLKTPLGAHGIRLVEDRRRGCGEYYSWVMSDEQQELFFAGRSVLHRIDDDLKARGLKSAEDVIARRVKDGAKIRVLFLNPTSDIVGRLAKEEDQSKDDLLSDIARSIGICKRLHELLRDVDKPVYLHVSLFDAVPYFAYHKEGSKVIVGFYFSSGLGDTSPAYEVVDEPTRRRFENHFSAIWNSTDTHTLIQSSDHKAGVQFDEQLFDTLCRKLIKELGTERAVEKIGFIPLRYSA